MQLWVALVEQGMQFFVEIKLINMFVGGECLSGNKRTKGKNKITSNEK
jgi:hypothetical protein